MREGAEAEERVSRSLPLLPCLSVAVVRVRIRTGVIMIISGCSRPMVLFSRGHRDLPAVVLYTG